MNSDIQMIAADSINYSSPVTLSNDQIKQLLDTVSSTGNGATQTARNADGATDNADGSMQQSTEDEIRAILEKRQTDACGDWQALGGKIAGQDIPDLNVDLRMDDT